MSVGLSGPSVGLNGPEPIVGQGKLDGEDGGRKGERPGLYRRSLSTARKLVWKTPLLRREPHPRIGNREVGEDVGEFTPSPNLSSVPSPNREVLHRVGVGRGRHGSRTDHVDVTTHFRCMFSLSYLDTEERKVNVGKILGIYTSGQRARNYTSSGKR